MPGVASSDRREEDHEEEGAKEEAHSTTDSSEYSSDSDDCSGEQADEVAPGLGVAGEMAGGTKQVLRKLASAAVNMHAGGAQGARYSFLEAPLAHKHQSLIARDAHGLSKKAKYKTLKRIMTK